MIKNCTKRFIKNGLKVPLVWLLLFIGYSLQATETTNLLELNYPQSLKIIKRIDWGWQPLLTPFNTHDVKYITVHHGGVVFSKDRNAAEHVRNLQSWSRKKKQWIDIPYHFMIDLDGNIFETRPINIPGDTNTEYDPTSHVLVEVMGNYEIQHLSEQQMGSMVALIQFLSKQFDVAIDDVKTHKDYSTQTACPGKNIYQYFQDGSIKERIIKK